MSYLAAATCIISTAQQAKPKVMGHSEPWGIWRKSPHFIPEQKENPYQTHRSRVVNQFVHFCKHIFSSIVYAATSSDRRTLGSVPNNAVGEKMTRRTNYDDDTIY